MYFAVCEVVVVKQTILYQKLQIETQTNNHQPIPNVRLLFGVLAIRWPTTTAVYEKEAPNCELCCRRASLYDIRIKRKTIHKSILNHHFHWLLLLLNASSVLFLFWIFNLKFCVLKYLCFRTEIIFGEKKFGHILLWCVDAEKKLIYLNALTPINTWQRKQPFFIIKWNRQLNVEHFFTLFSQQMPVSI